MSEILPSDRIPTGGQSIGPGSCGVIGHATIQNTLSINMFNKINVFKEDQQICCCGAFPGALHCMGMMDGAWTMRDGCVSIRRAASEVY